MKDSKIEWTDHTFNPWEGCTKVSPGCANCYAATRNARFGGGTATNWGKGAPRRRTSAENWKQPVKWNREAEAEYVRLAHQTGAGEVIKFKRPRVFCASLADWLDDEVDPRWLYDLLHLVRMTPMLDWLLLTKRPQNFFERLRAAWATMMGEGDQATLDFIRLWGMDGKAPANVWIGTSVEDQPRADERIPALLRIPARVRFLSCEPLLGPVDLTAVSHTVSPGYFGDAFGAAHLPGTKEQIAMLPEYPRIHWVIVGGESGPGARPMHPAWARNLRDQCAEAGVAFFFKQWGEWAPGVAHLKRYDVANPKAYVNEVRWVSTGRTVGITEHTKQRNLTTPEREPHRFEDGEILTYRVGKEEAGRRLDGREWNEVPGGAS